MSNAIFTQTCYFTEPGPRNTATCLDIGARSAAELGIEKILIATCTGKTALRALDYFDLKKHRLIAVSHVTGFIRPNEQEMPGQVRDELIAKGFRVRSESEGLRAKDSERLLYGQENRQE